MVDVREYGYREFPQLRLRHSKLEKGKCLGGATWQQCELESPSAKYPALWDYEPEVRIRTGAHGVCALVSSKTFHGSRAYLPDSLNLQVQ